MPKVEHYVEPLMVEIGGVYSYLHVTIATLPDARRCIFLFHDLAGRSDDFTPLVPHLVQLGYKVVMIDLPGRGKSAVLDEADYTLRMYVDVFFALIKAHGLNENAALGQGWGAMMALLFESFIGQPFQRIYLFDLPTQWSFATDAMAQAWAELAQVRAVTLADFLSEADSAVPDNLIGRADFLALAAERVRTVDGKHQLSLDPAIFGNLRKSGNKQYNVESALYKVRSPIWLLQGTQSSVPLVSQAISERGHLSQLINYTQIIQGSNISWYNDALLLPALGAVQIGGPSRLP